MSPRSTPTQTHTHKYYNTFCPFPLAAALPRHCCRDDAGKRLLLLRPHENRVCVLLLKLGLSSRTWAKCPELCHCAVKIRVISERNWRRYCLITSLSVRAAWRSWADTRAVSHCPSHGAPPHHLTPPGIAGPVRAKQEKQVDFRKRKKRN